MGDIDKIYFNIYSSKYSKVKDLRTITFYDDSKEGEFISKLFTDINKKNPYLICYFNINNNYYLYNYKMEKFEDFIWYENYVEGLNEVRSWYKGMFQYLISIPNEYSFLKIMEMSFSKQNIVEFIISGDSSFTEIEKIMEDNYYSFDNLKEASSISWIYGHYYGDSSGEHHAFFYAKDAKYTDKLSSYLEKDRWFSRY